MATQYCTGGVEALLTCAGSARASSCKARTMIPVYLINLDRDHERLSWMRGQLDPLGIVVERVPAVLGRDLPAEVCGYFGVVDGAIGGGLRPGEIGCYASHIVCWQRLVASGAPAALVLEDDLETRTPLARICARVADLPAGWDLVRLSGIVKRATADVGDLGDGLAIVKFSRIPLGAGAYLISRAGAGKLLGDRRPRSEAVDIDLRQWWRFGLATYGVMPLPVTQDVLQKSSIESLGGRKVQQRSHRTAGLAYPAAKLSGFYHQVRFLGPRAWVRCALANAARSAGLA